MTYKILKPFSEGLLTALIENQLTQERLRELLEYNEELGEFFWKTKTSSRGYLPRVGDKAGTPDTHGSIQIRINGKKYQSHRLLWLYYFGKFPSGWIDHIDGNPSNNRLGNLREVSSAENNRNRKIPITNTSGVMGVRVELSARNGKICHKWCASWVTKEGKSKTKSFAVLKYGYEAAKALATAFRENKIQELNSEGAGYTARHGSCILKT